ncbi:MAG: hypothetical protein ACFCBU_10205 [Cyanophyceae cyanobacterium]
MNLELHLYRAGAIAIGTSIVTQLISFLLHHSFDLGLWFSAVFAVLLVGVGMAMLLKFRLSEWLLDALAIALGLAGGIVL